MKVHISFGILSDKRCTAAEILYEGFRDKFEKTFKSKDVVIPVLAQGLCSDRTVTAFHNNELVGVAGLNFGGKEFIDVRFLKLLRTLKVGIIKFLFLGIIFKSNVKKDELFVDMIAVTPPMQSKSIGKALLDFTIDFARSNQYKRVFLFVTTTNKRAILFYEKMGFEKKRVRTVFYPWRKILGFDGLIEMEYYTIHTPSYQ